MTKTLEERFLAKVKVTPGGCHEWTGHIMPNGYGQVRAFGKTAYAHRVAYRLAHGRDPGDLFVLHKCDNRRCVNPEHLSLGTFNDNMADMVEKRRQAHGVKNGHSKLSPQQVREIRAASGTQSAIAEQFGVVQPLVSMIKTGRIWKHV